MCRRRRTTIAAQMTFSLFYWTVFVVICSLHFTRISFADGISAAINRYHSICIHISCEHRFSISMSKITEHTRNHIHYNTITKPTLTHVEWFSLWLDYFIKLLLLLIPLVLSLLLFQFHTYSNLAHAPQSGNKTKPISESQNNTETIFLCGDAHKFTHTHDDHKMLPFAALRSQWFAMAFDYVPSHTHTA